MEHVEEDGDVLHALFSFSPLPPVFLAPFVAESFNANIYVLPATDINLVEVPVIVLVLKSAAKRVGRAGLM